jgi:hypothetical protein
MILCPQCLKNYHPKVNFCPSCNIPLPKVMQGEAMGAMAAGDTTLPVKGSKVVSTPTPVAPLPTAPEPVAAKAVVEIAQKIAPTPAAADIPPPAPKPAAVEPDAFSMPGSSDRLAKADTVHIESLSHEVKQEVAAALQESQAAVAYATMPPRQPLELTINLNRILIEGTGTTLEMKLQCTNPDPLLDVHVQFQSDKSLKHSFEERFHVVEHGQPVDQFVEIDFLDRCMGVRLLNCLVTYTQLGRRKSMKGQVQITILKQPAAGNFHLELSNIGNQIVNSDGSNAGLGSEHQSSLCLKELVDFGSIRDVNDLLSATLPDNFITIPLRQTGDVPTGARIIASAFLKKVQAGTVLTLEPVGAVASALPLRLTARSQFLFGRQRDACDLVTWFMPRSPENDELTRCMSKVHVAAFAKDDGLFLRRQPGVASVTLSGVIVGESEPGTALIDYGRLSMQAVPGANFVVDMLHHAAIGSAAPAAENARLWPGPPVDEKPAITGCVICRPVDRPPAFRNCLWLFTEAAFGSGEENPIYLPDSGLASVQGRIHHYRNCFWIENSADTGTVRVEGQRLRSGELAPLCSGMVVRLGGIEFKVLIEA